VVKEGTFTNDGTAVSAFDRTGYHRTQEEIKKKDVLREKTYGGIITLPLFYLNQIGIAFLKTQYDPPLNPFQSKSDKRRIFYRFQGDQVQNISLFFTINHNTLNSRGEVAWSNLKDFAYSFTLLLGKSDWRLLIKNWYVTPNFQSPFGRTLSGSASFPQASAGIMISCSGRPWKKLRLNGYWSLEKELWRTYFQPLPTHSKSFYLSSDYLWDPRTKIQFRYQISTSSFFHSQTARSIKKRKHGLRLQLDKRISAKVRFRSRFEKTILNFSEFLDQQQGLNFFQDIYWRLSRFLSFQFRYSSFNSDDYDSRVYEYETDLPGVFSNYPLYGRGNKWYIMTILDITEKLKIWFKYRRYQLDGVNAIGSGYAVISGDQKQDLHLQLQYRY
jgi:hypothetical protein